MSWLLKFIDKTLDKGDKRKSSHSIVEADGCNGNQIGRMFYRLIFSSLTSVSSCIWIVDIENVTAISTLHFQLFFSNFLSICLFFHDPCFFKCRGILCTITMIYLLILLFVHAFSIQVYSWFFSCLLQVRKLTELNLPSPTGVLHSVRYNHHAFIYTLIFRFINRSLFFQKKWLPAQHQKL